MASFYQNLYSKQDMLPPAYLLNHKPDSYHSTELDSNEVYPSVSLPYSNLLSESNHQYHGLSLTLGSHHPQLPQLNSDLNQYSPSLLTSPTNDLKNIHFHYPSFDLAHDAVSKESAFIPALDHGSNYTPTLCNSRYVKAAQDLLNELVSLHTSRASISAAEPHESTDNASHDLQNKVTRLLSMLDELDRRYKKYRHQMQAVVSSFDILAGCGAARPYTALALQTISRQFRCLRDAIKKQIRATQKSLGEHDGVGVLSRLRYVDQQLRQQKAHHQFGVMRQPWRPQRGLPETAVSVLRAWLFEHFLHPYPKDSEKLVLARHAGLTRSQVANWFINARVRLWKPMIEEMYKEEFGETETELKCSPDHEMPSRETSVFDDRDEEFQGSMVSAEFSRGFHGSREVIFGLTDIQPSNQVSLALGLQRDKKARETKPDEAQGNEDSQSSTPLEYYYTEPVDNQHRFGNTHLLSDFVA